MVLQSILNLPAPFEALFRVSLLADGRCQVSDCGCGVASSRGRKSLCSENCLPLSIISGPEVMLQKSIGAWWIGWKTTGRYEGTRAYCHRFASLACGRCEEPWRGTSYIQNVHSSVLKHCELDGLMVGQYLIPVFYRLLVDKISPIKLF